MVTVTPFKEGKASYCMIEIRDVSDMMTCERQLLEHAESLRTQSHIDSLTGLYNRGYFDRTLERELQRARRTGAKLSLLLMQIGSFKAYNDHFGHQEGDSCLIIVAKALTAMLKRAGDVGARYGGKDFSAVLSGTSLAKARTVANPIREIHCIVGARAHANCSPAVCDV
ncbi:diguanylate cyclase domain-containing protein [Massilia niabensis]|uniref:diguanylate cyclase n=1 Tax=Massilia niabensis TaxID=544910 RepID=A0ABW0LCC2_9BURK